MHGMVYSRLRFSGSKLQKHSRNRNSVTTVISCSNDRAISTTSSTNPRRRSPGEFEQEEREETEPHARLNVFKAQAWSIQASATKPEQKLCYLCYLLFKRPRNLEHPAQDPRRQRPSGNLNTSEGKTCVGLDNLASGLVGSRQH